MVHIAQIVAGPAFPEAVLLLPGDFEVRLAAFDRVGVLFQRFESVAKVAVGLGLSWSVFQSLGNFEILCKVRFDSV
jgi:hypothetical protein